MKIQAGYYTGRVVAGEGAFGDSKNGENIEATIPMDLLVDGDGQPIEPPHRVTVYLSFSEKAEEYSVAKLKALGWKSGDLTFSNCPNEVTVSIKYETYQGRERMKADILAGPVVRPLDKGREAAFMARMSSLMGSGPARPKVDL